VKAEEFSRARELVRSFDQDSEPSALQQSGAAVLANWKLFVPLALAGLLLGMVSAWVTPRAYSADALVEIESQTTGLPVVDPYLGQSNSGQATEAEILQSRAVLQAAVRNANLDIDVQPRYFPLIGQAMARRHATEEAPRPPPFDALEAGRDAWGGERVTVGRFDLDDRYRGVRFKLTAQADGAYTLEASAEALGSDAPLTAAGRVGESLSLGADGKLGQLLITGLVARPGTEFQLQKVPEADAMERLARNLDVTWPAQTSAIMRVHLTAGNPPLAQRALDAVTQAYVAQNIARSSAEAQQRLDFLQHELPGVKSTLDQAQAKLLTLKSRIGAVQDLSAEAQGVLRKFDESQAQLTKLNTERDQLLLTLTPDHPMVKANESAIQRLRGEQAALEGVLRKLPDAEAQYVQFSRDEKVAADLYAFLSNQAQQFAIAKAGTIGSVRIVDTASLPRVPSRPNVLTIVSAHVLAAFLLGVAILLLRRLLLGAIDDPETVEKRVGLPIFAAIPHSRLQARMGRSRQGADNLSVLAHTDAGDIAMESVRSLRTSVQFALGGGSKNLVSIVGPTSGVGKSFVSLNLAYLFAEGGKRVLLVDGDMRRGHLHSAFRFERAPGLSEYLSGQMRLEEVIRPSGIHPRLSVITTGTVPPNPSELLMSDALDLLCVETAAAYDLVIFDTPPVLSVADAVIICSRCQTILLTARAGKTSIAALQMTIKKLLQNGSVVAGAVCNDYRLKLGQAGYYEYKHAHHKYGA